MTEDYKEQLLNYVTGDLENTTPSQPHDEFFKQIVEANWSDWRYYIPATWQNMHCEGIIKSNTGDVCIMYGGYYTDSITNGKGFIIIVDNEFNPIKYIEEFSSGTPLRYIQCLKQAEDNSFYMVDDNYFSYNDDTGLGYLTNGQRRFVMLNNFTIKNNGEYEVVLRTSYNFDKSYSGTDIDSQQNNIYVKNMAKDPNSSNYVFIGKRYNTTASKTGFNLIHIVQLTINVEEANTWKHWTFTNERCYYGGSYIDFNGSGNPYFRVIGAYDGGNGIYQLTKNYNTDTLTSSVIYTNATYPDDDIPTKYFENQCVFLNKNKVYFVVSNQWTTWSGTAEDKHIALCEYDFSNSQLTQIYERYLGQNTLPDYYLWKDAIFLSENQGYLYIQYCKDYLWENSEYTANYYVQRYDGVWNPILIKENGKCSLRQRGFYVLNNYNLVKIFCCPINFRSPTWYFPIIKEIYNPSQYNGESYIDTNVLNPLYANLYSNGSLIFSRNLYNISKQNNMTMSSVEIPNNYLNDTTITQNDLISETNFQMNSDNTQWTKNVYEVVDLNFLNTITVTDVEENESYLQGAIRINNAITDVNDYSDMTCTKARINYTDSTTKVISVVWTPIDELHKETEITLYVSSPIMSIDFISEDEETIYLTKMLEVEQDKYYTIKQKIRIGDE